MLDWVGHALGSPVFSCYSPFGLTEYLNLARPGMEWTPRLC